MPRISLRAALIATGVITPAPDDYIPLGNVTEPVDAAALSIGDVYGYQALYRPRAEQLRKQQKRKRNV